MTMQCENPVLVDIRQTILFGITAGLLLNGCSQRQMYRTGQDYQKQMCLDGPPSEYDECMPAAEKSFEQYQEEREELEKDDEL